jgi:hypothetical protein
MTVLVWLVLLASPVSNEERYDRYKVFYSRLTWRPRQQYVYKGLR